MDNKMSIPFYCILTVNLCTDIISVSGGYNNIIEYTFHGLLGVLLFNAIDFSGTGEVYFGYQYKNISEDEIDDRHLSNNMSFNEFMNIFLQYFCDEPSFFKKYL